MSPSHDSGRSHDAPASLAGYLYQVRYALLRALEEGKRNPGHVLLIEKFDDVAFQKDGTAIELIQTKHHVRQGNVTDQSVDLWKSLAVWMDRLSEDPNGTAKTRLVLVTTNNAGDDSALSMLRQSGCKRDEEAAVESLIFAAQQSKNTATHTARSQFLTLTDVERRVLVDNIWVFDRTANLADMRAEIENEVYYSAPIEQLSDFTDQLEGWWFSRIVDALGGDDASEITLVSVVRKVSELRERFKIGNLVVDDELESMAPNMTLDDDKRTFVRQMRIVEVPDRERKASVYDYYRAYQQRSRWARQNLLLDGETDHYDRGLHDAWERRFLAYTAEVDGETDEDQKRALGRGVFRWSREHQKPLRNRDELWLSSGSFQMLADSKRIGWHPDFDELIPEQED